MSNISGNDVVRCAIYLRSACGEAGSSSFTDQEQLCREAIARHSGWYLDDGLIFRDLGRPGTTLNGRNGLNDLVARAAEHPRPFDKVIVADAGRLGREVGALRSILTAFRCYGVSVYLASACLDSTDPSFETVVICLFVAEEHRFRETGRRVLRGRRARVLQGLSAGGSLYGYSSSPLMVPADERTTSRRVSGAQMAIVDSEAITIRWIYSEFASGTSASEIAMNLNARQVPGPRKAKWKSRHVYAVLRRSLYRGRLLWRRTRTVMDFKTGKRVRHQLPPSEVLCVDTPRLRIVDVDLASAVDERLASIDREGNRRMKS